MSGEVPFQPTGPLPVGRTTMIEASAGTGKTYALTALAVRFVVELDVPIAKVLLVTFTRAATAELRGRVRERLVEVARYLDEPWSEADEVLEHLGRVTPEERAVRRERALRAVRDFDTATVNTIHAFCSVVLGSLGALAGRNAEAVPSESDTELVRQVCDDLYFRRVLEAGAPPVAMDPSSALPSVTDLDVGKLVANVTKARATPGCRIDPPVDPAVGPRTATELMAVLVAEACAEVTARLTASGGLSFNTLLTATLGALEDDPDLVAQVRQQFTVALVDEFQDTDPVQWAIFRLLFGGASPASTLVLVGDPKQAIYAFRGGDVYTYLAARREAAVMTLGTNQRSDPAVVAAMNALGDGEHFGDLDIPYLHVEAADRHADRALVGPDGSARPGLRVRCLAKMDADPARERIFEDLADVVVETLGGGRADAAAAVRDGDADPVPLRPGDLAVLLGAKRHGPVLADALRRRGVPAVIRGGDDVADSEAAEQWRVLLSALDRPTDPRRALAAALGWFVGWEAENVAAALAEDDAAEELLAELQSDLHRWSELLSTQGLPAVLGAVRREHRLDARLLAGPLGERRLTDLEHLAELVHAAAPAHRGMSAAHALDILSGLGGTPDDDVAAEASQRRIESDAEAVQIMTIHTAKGLEFPVVLLPDLHSGGDRVKANAPFSYCDTTTAPGRRVLHVAQTGGELEDSEKHEVLAQNCGDQHRLTYVAMTRAVHQTVVWWTPSTLWERTGLGRLLFEGGDTPPGCDLFSRRKAGRQKPDDLVGHIRDRVAARGAAEIVEVTEVTGPPSATPATYAPEVGPDAPAEPYRHAEVGRPLHRGTFKWSFSRLTDDRTSAAARPEGDPGDSSGGDAGASDEVGRDLTGLLDEVVGTVGAVAPPDGRSAEWDRPPLFEGLGSGIVFGRLMHSLLEDLDFTSADLPAEVVRWVDAQRSYRTGDDHARRLPVEVEQVLLTPLGPDFGGLRLRDLAMEDRLNELDFLMHLSHRSGPATGPGPAVPAARIGETVLAHLGPDDPLRKWAGELTETLRPLHLEGFLNGSADLVLRFEHEGVERFSVVDYKTNRLTDSGAEPRLADYRPSRLPVKMAASDYPLQALLYSVVLHRFLRWRLAGYDPDVHLGPVGYLFVRGMVGPDTPTDPVTGVPAGVFSWPLPPGLVPALSDLLAGFGVDGGAS